MRSFLLFIASLCFSCVAMGQSTSWLASNEPVTVERGAKATLKIAAKTTAIEAANLFVVAKAIGATAHIDLTPVVSLKDDTLELDLALISVPAGKYELEFSHIDAGGKIQELDKAVLTVTAPGAAPDDKGGAAPASIEPNAEKSEFKPKLDIGIRGQLYERRNADAGPSQRARYKDMTLEGGFETLNSAEDWEVKTSFSFSGNSNINEAVQYGNKGTDAYKIDMTNYLVEGGLGTTRFALGNINVSTHPLLVQGISNRGVSVSGKLPLGVDVNASLQNGGGIQAGIDNLFGISQPMNMFRQIGFGLDLEPEKPGKARFDFTRLSATQRVGQLAGGGDAIEKSEGHGLRFSGRNDDGRGRVEVSVATSTQTPAGAPPAAINQGYAWTGEVGYDILKDYAWRPELPISFNTAFRVEHSSPVYRSLGSSYGSNFRQQAGIFNLKVGPSQVQGQIVRRYDNVGADQAYLRNKLSSWSLNASFPLDQLVKAWQGKPEAPASVSANETEEKKAELAKAAEEAKKPNPYWPALTYQRKSVLGFGDSAFIPTGYGFDDLPMVHVYEQSFGLRWAFERVQLGIKRAHVEQDNRQVGHESEDVTDNKWGYSVDYKASETLTLGASHDLANNLRYQTGVVADQFQTKVSATYNMTPDTTLLAEVNRSLSRDTSTALNMQRGYQVQWTTKFKTPAFGKVGSLPGQFYFRYLGTDGFTGSSTAASTMPVTYAVQFGVTFSIF
jgi:hypothetical protein